MTTATTQRFDPYAYAAQVRARNKPPCQCERCIRDALLPAVVQITERWPLKEKKVRRVK